MLIPYEYIHAIRSWPRPTCSYHLCYYCRLIDWSSLFRLMLLRNLYTGDGAVGVTTMLLLVTLWVVFATACGAASRCGVVTLTAPLSSSVYILRILIVLISINATPKYVHWRWVCRYGDCAVACGTPGCLLDNPRCHICGVVTQTAPPCSSVYTPRIYMLSLRRVHTYCYLNS